MTDLSAPFAPDWVSLPGDSVLDSLEEKGWSQRELADRLGYTEKHVSQLVNGKVPITVDAAQRLERVLGSTVDFWLALEANYQRHKARIESQAKCASWVPWLARLPVKQLMECGAIPDMRNDARNRPSIVEHCLRFFGVASPADWERHYGGMEVAFRKSRSDQDNLGSISAWLRLGEQAAEQMKPVRFSRERLERNIPSIRALTCEPPEVFEPRLRTLLQDSGVLLVLVPGIRGAKVSGVARWLTPTVPLIQLSLYGKSNDRFWFTLFHELAHILLHANTADEKRSVFLDDPGATEATDEMEIEADSWAADILIPPEHKQRLRLLRSHAEVTSFAAMVGIHPGIVVGRLQHDKIILQSWMNDLKARFEMR